MKKATILAVLVVVFAVAACSGDEAEPVEEGGSSTTEAEQGCDSPVETATIQIADLAFDPDCIELPAGTDSLTIENTDDTDHTFTIAEINLNTEIGPSADVGVDVAAINDGVWAFRCTIHPQMTGFLTRR
ncbi:MAG TPA: cupredoxin domain-containing protein [Actinomycetota bacterium]